MSPLVVDARGIRKRYGDLSAVDDVSLAVAAGEVVTLVGPNGAGKTTLIEILEGLRTADAGTVRVLGEDPAHPSRAWLQRIGVEPQPPAGFFNHITPHEAVWLFASFYEQPTPPDELLASVGLSAKRDTVYAHLSAGQRQRLSLALAIINTPQVLFLDEPTTGLDPEARRDTWTLVRSLSAKGTSVLLSTHDIADAEPVSDRVGVMVNGRLLALESPQRLIGASGAEGHVDLYLGALDTPEVCVAALPGVSRLERNNGILRLFTQSPQTLVAEMGRHGAPLAGLFSSAPYQVFTPRLQDAYFKLTAAERPL